MKRLVHRQCRVDSGIKLTPDGLAIDLQYNHPDDIIDIVEPQLYESYLSNNIYNFGYRFKESASTSQRSRFIHAIKQIGDVKLSDSELDQFIKRPLKYLNEAINLQDIDCFVYPLSGRSPLVSKVVRAINDMTSREMKRCSFEFVKQAPTDIKFDFDSFESDHGGDAGYYDMIRYINNDLLPKIRNLDYFSLAQNVKSKYRKYITNFLSFNDVNEIEKFSKLKGSSILVVDDINTTGSTLQEILRILTKVNSNCNVYVYTLIGR